MSLKYTIVIIILLISAMSMTGCTGTGVAAPTPTTMAATVQGTPAPAGTVAPASTYAAWTTETPATGHPYSKTFSFSGSGDYQDFTFTTDNDATWVFRMEPGQGYFLVSLKDAQGKEIEVLPASGTKSVWLNAGNYHFDIAADSPWHITMTTP